MRKRIYLRLLVYNYDTSPRGQWIEHTCHSVEHAKLVRDRLHKLMGVRYDQNHTDRWLDRNHHIYGIVEHVEGVYEETTRKI